MKTITRNISAAFAAMIALSGMSSSQAADLTIDGGGYYELGSRISYYGGGVQQSGRYGNLGGDYYHKTVIGARWITNRSARASGDLSFEFWAMPYYGATQGIVLMTRSLDRLRAGSYYTDKAREGWAVFLDRWRFPEINLYEYTLRGWKWRDALSFKRRNLL